MFLGEDNAHPSGEWWAPFVGHAFPLSVNLVRGSGTVRSTIPHRSWARCSGILARTHPARLGRGRSLAKARLGPPLGANTAPGSKGPVGLDDEGRIQVARVVDIGS